MKDFKTPEQAYNCGYNDSKDGLPAVCQTGNHHESYMKGYKDGKEEFKKKH